MKIMKQEKMNILWYVDQATIAGGVIECKLTTSAMCYVKYIILHGFVWRAVPERVNLVVSCLVNTGLKCSCVAPLASVVDTSVEANGSGGQYLLK